MQKPLHYLYFGMISCWQIALRLFNHELASRASHIEYSILHNDDLHADEIKDNTKQFSGAIPL